MVESQAYYWTPEWQEHERESVAALERGEGCRFSSAQEAIAGLLSEDDDDDRPDLSSR